MEERKYCVYKHTSPSQKVYIGITKQSANGRWKNGFGYKSSPHFWNAIQKYGWDSIDHEVLFSDLTCDEACSKEKELIEFYNSIDRRFGYNEKTGGEAGVAYNEFAKKKISESLKSYYANHPEKVAEISARVKGFKHSEETKAKMSAAKKGRTFTQTPEWKRHIGEANKRNILNNEQLYDETVKRCRENGKRASKEIVQLDLDGNEICRYESGKAAYRATGIRDGNINNCCRGVTKTAGGYKWQFANEYNSSRETA